MIPKFLYDKLINQYGIDLTNKIIEGYSKKRLTTLRINTIKTDKNYIINVLNENNIEYQNLSFYDDALIILNCDEFKLRGLDIYNDGLIYFQSLSSMIPPLVLNPNDNESILDMCAAPGSKTCQMAQIANNKCLITACEKNKIRADRLRYNINKLGIKGVGVIEIDSKKLDDFLIFDKILLDAPCSGSGTLYLYDEKLERRISLDLINNSAKLQFELLKKAVKLLKAGSEMVYSTCSILKEENEDIINKILRLDKNLELVELEKIYDNASYLPTLDKTICIAPNELYEGFYIAKIRKIR